VPASFDNVIILFILSLLQHDDKRYCGEGQDVHYVDKASCSEYNEFDASY
jgi:hypothetical protein